MKSILSLFFALALTSCFSQKLVSSKLLPCNHFSEDVFRERIASQRFSQDTLYLELNFSANCDADLKPTLKSVSDSLFIDLKDISQIHAACNCCYSMLFTIAGISNPSYTLFVNNREFTFSKSRYIDVPPQTIPKELLRNELTADGLKVGYWKIKGQKDSYHHVFYGNKPLKDNQPLWIKSFNRKGELTSVGVSIVKPSETYSIDIPITLYEHILKENPAQQP